MDIEHLSLQWRAKVHAALGEPARLAIIDALSLGDSSPGEIARSLGLPTNLVAHHLKVLRDAGLVGRTRSEGDRRRSYVHLQPEALAALAPPPLGGVPRVLFVCTHNSARSQLAAALWSWRTRIPSASAGTRPAPQVHPRAIEVARRHGLTLRPDATAHVSEIVRDDDFVVAVCDNAHESLIGAIRTHLHWSVPDPAVPDTDAAFEATFVELASRVDRLVPALGGVS